MNFNEMKEQFVGKRLLSVITLDTTEEYIKSSLKTLTKNHYNDVDSAQLLLFENNMALVFVDFDCDGYRSGNWNVLFLEEVLDKGQTKGIKEIDSIVKDIEYHKKEDDEDFLLVVTEKYVIRMGQNYSDSYYPCNFFNIEECKQVAILGKGYDIEFPEEVSK